MLQIFLRQDQNDLTIGITNLYDFVINKKIWHHVFEEHGVGQNKLMRSLKSQLYSMVLQESCAVTNNLPKMSRKCIIIDVIRYTKFWLINESHLQPYHCW
jgi:hypothetical protein